MMKRVSAFVSKVVLVALLGIFVVLPFGCGSTQLGETAAESRRRQARTLRINHTEMMADINSFLLLDEPSRLTEMRIP
jgi:hypothetical protein